MQFQPTKPRFGDQTPPAIFPPILGLIGLALAWGRAPSVFGLPKEVGELVLGAATCLLLFAIFAYAVKFARRPGVLTEDLRSVPGRAGLATMVLALFCLAAGMVPFSPGLATGILFAALALHTVLAVLKIRLFLSIPSDQRPVTPVWHLSFVGFIVAPLSAIPLGYMVLSQIIFVGTLIAACGIWAVTIPAVLKKGCPPPLRPTLTIHIAPMSFFVIVAVGLGWTTVALIFGVLAALSAALLLARVSYLTASGFTPFWGAFTFPLAAFSSAMLVLAPQGTFFGVLGAISLAAGSAVVPVIAVKVLKLWAGGQLALKTNAARV